MFLAGFAAREALLDLVGRHGARTVVLGTTLLVAAATLAGTVALCRRLGLYEDVR